MAAMTTATRRNKNKCRSCVYMTLGFCYLKRPPSRPRKACRYFVQDPFNLRPGEFRFVFHLAKGNDHE